MSLSIKQIAELAGVSRGTVDRAINGREGINPEIKAKILAIAAEAGYRTNRAGKMLGIRKKPFKIGIQMPAVGNDFFVDVQAGLGAAAVELADYGLELMIRTMKGYSVEKQIAQIRDLVAEGIHALAFVPIDHPDISSLLNELSEREIPVMTINTDITVGPRLGYIGNDYFHSGTIAAGLMGLIAGKRPLKTLILTGSTRILGHNQRIAGFEQTVKQNYPEIGILDVEENQDDDNKSYQLVKAALTRWPEMDALYLTAAGVAGACQALQDHAGERRITLICFDQTKSAAPFQKSGLITASIGQEPFQQGYLAIKLLFEYLLDGTKPPPRTLTRNEIFIREHLLQR